MKKKRVLPKRAASLITTAIFLIITLIIASCSLVVNRSEVDDDIDNVSDVLVDETDSTYDDDIDSISDDNSDVNFENSSSEVEEPTKPAEPEEKEPKHVYIKNEYGYTFIYGDSGYEQFFYNEKTVDRYVKGLNSLPKHFPETTKIYNISVPVASSFASFPAKVKEEHQFYSKKPSAFINAYEPKLEDVITNISIVDVIFNAYNNGEYVFFRTDNNWTPIASYNAYVAFCEQKGITPHDISEFPKQELNGYLGWFHFATKDADMEANPDEFEYYLPLPSIPVELNIYEGIGPTRDYELCKNEVGLYDAYDIFVGTTAGRCEINTLADGGNLLIIADSSVLPMLPFLAAHYETIDIINPMYFSKTISQFLVGHQYDDVITMCYTTNATAGDFTPAFNKFVEAPINNE